MGHLANYRRRHRRRRLSMRAAARHAEVHLATIFRWWQHGVRGRRLETFLVGGRRYVYLDSLEAFTSPVPTPLSGTDSSARASAAADQLGRRGI